MGEDKKGKSCANCAINHDGTMLSSLPYNPIDFPIQLWVISITRLIFSPPPLVAAFIWCRATAETDL